MPERLGAEAPEAVALMAANCHVRRESPHCQPLTGAAAPPEPQARTAVCASEPTAQGGADPEAAKQFGERAEKQRRTYARRGEKGKGE